ncbi:MAG: TonB-dependent receptor [Cellvibrionales bacterium]|nr:TonB-dependent receptor [Cellvibrionales bacterium]
MHHLHPFLCLVYTSVFSCAVYAQNNAKHLGIETTEVFGIKSDQPDSITLVDKTQYTGFIQTIDRSAFEGRLVSFGEILNRLPGIQVKQSGGFGSNAQVAIRGTGNKRVNIFVDGMPMNSSASGNAKLQYIPSVLIEQVDTYPYFTPVELGNANLGGAINFSTRDINKQDAGGQVSLGGGSFSTQFADVSGWGDLGGYQGMIGFSHFESENDFEIKKEVFYSPFDTRNGNVVEKRKNDAIDQQSVFFKGSKDWDNLGLNLLIQHYQVEKGLPTQSNDSNDDATFYEENLAIQTLIDYELGDWQLGHRPFFLTESALLDDPNNQIGLNPNKMHTDTDKLGLANSIQTQISQHQIAINLELQADQLTREDEYQSSQDLATDRNSLILSASDNWAITPRLRFASVVRFYQVNDDWQFTENASKSDKSENQETAWHTGLSWAITQNLRFNSNVGQSIRIPTLYEKFGSSGLYEGEPELKREKASNFDLGFNYSTQKINGGVNGFISEINDGIVIIYDSRGIGHPENIGRAMLGGMAIDVNWKPLDWLAMGTNATLLLSENFSKIKDAKGKKMPGIYHNSLGAFITLNHRWVEWTIHYNQDGELYYDNSNDVKGDDKQLLATNLTFFIDRLTLDFTANNLLDENYRDANYQPIPGQSLISTLTIDL